TLLAWPVLGEPLTRFSILGLVLCVAGLWVLISPVAASGGALGLILALGSAVSWAAGTLYLKWARIEGSRIAITAWQLLVSFVVLAACFAWFEGVPQLSPLRATTLAALAFQGLIATGLAYLLWFEIVVRLSVAAASLGSLCVPVVGIVSSILMLGERPTFADLVGFVLILAAAASVLLEPATRSAVPPRKAA